MRPPIFTLGQRHFRNPLNSKIKHGQAHRHCLSDNTHLLYLDRSSEYSWQSGFLSADNVAAPQKLASPSLRRPWHLLASVILCRGKTKLWREWWWKEVKSDQQQRPVQVTWHHMRTLAHLVTGRIWWRSWLRWKLEVWGPLWSPTSSQWSFRTLDFVFRTFGKQTFPDVLVSPSLWSNVSNVTNL